MFRVGLVLFKHILGRPEQMSDCPTLYETMEKIRNIPAEYMKEGFLIREVGGHFTLVCKGYVLSEML